jgi:hypothetical protein
MKYIWVILLLTFKTSANEGLIKSINSLNTTLNSTKTISCPNPISNSDLDTFEYAQKNHKVKFACSKTKDFNGLKWHISKYYCKDNFGQTAFTCTENDSQKIKKRMDNPSLMLKTTLFTQEKFIEYKESLAKKCCPIGALKCLNRFKKVKLDIVESTKSYAKYQSGSDPVNFGTNGNLNKIFISTSKLASNYTKESVERILLHEMGHVCQFALLSEDKEKYTEFTASDKRCLASTGQKYFNIKKISSSSCVMNKLKETMKNNKGDFCYGKWHREAFADMIFRSEMKTVYHWSYDLFRTKPSKNYGSVYEYIQCDMENYPRKSICSE